MKKKAGKKRTAPDVSIELPSAALDLARSLVPASAHETFAALRRGDTGVNCSTQYLPIIVEAILRNVIRGHKRGEAAELAGVRAATLYNWMQEHPDLGEALAHAEAAFVHEMLDVIRSGFPRNPRLALELLERRLPKEWAPLSRTEHSGAVMHGLFTDPDLLQKLAMARAKRDARLAASAPTIQLPPASPDSGPEPTGEQSQ